MNSKSTWVWALVAAGLLVGVSVHQRFGRKPVTGPLRILPSLNAATVTRVQVRPKGQLEIRAERTNGGWQLLKPLPLPYPARTASIEKLLAALERLTPATYITPRELQAHPKAEEEYGLAPEPDSLIIQQGDYRVHLLVGSRTAPGDQVFVQVIGVDGVYVVDAEWLKLIPQSPNDWRDTTLLNLKPIAFDRLTITNGSKFLELQRDATNSLWRILRPSPARADTARIEECLEKLQSVRIQKFFSDDPKTELEPLGLQPAELELVLAQGTNTLTRLQFGKSPTNDPQQVYARRLGQAAIVTVAKDLLQPWRISGSANEFRDPRLVGISETVEALEVRGEDAFSVERQASNSWRVLPQNFPADAALVAELLSTLTNLQIVDFVKDVVAEPDWPTYGLAAPVRQYILKFAATNSPPPAGPGSIQLNFGTNQDNKVFVRRSDESSVYAVKLSDFERLQGLGGWRLRERQIWNLSERDVAGVTIRQQGKVRQIIRTGDHKWSLGLNSQGMIDPDAVEETVRGLTKLAAAAWVARGQQSRAQYGLTEDGHQVSLDLKDGNKLMVEFGHEAPSSLRYAGVTLEGDLWIFECPWLLYRDVQAFLSIPTN